MIEWTALVAAGMALVGGTTPASERNVGIGPHLATLQDFGMAEGDRLWPGFGAAPQGFLLLGDDEEILYCRQAVPAGFTPSGIDPATGCRTYRRGRTALPGGLLAAMPMFGPPAVIVMGSPAATGLSEASWVRTIVHERFHQWQYQFPGYFDRIAALDLHGGDETGMWILDYPYPYDRPGVVSAHEAASRSLAAAVEARASPDFLAAFDRYLVARDHWAQQSGERNWRYLEFQLWQEGVARWTEIRLGKWYPRQDVRDSALALEEATLSGLAAPDLGKRRREIVYAHGAAEAMLLQACWPEWRASYQAHLALGPMLKTARARCALRMQPAP